MRNVFLIATHKICLRTDESIMLRVERFAQVGQTVAVVRSSRPYGVLLSPVFGAERILLVGGDNPVTIETGQLVAELEVSDAR